MVEVSSRTLARRKAMVSGECKLHVGTTWDMHVHMVSQVARLQRARRRMWVVHVRCADVTTAAAADVAAATAAAAAAAAAVGEPPC
jgi:hypothetical protein